ncbi:MAG: hypothetical protein NC402_00510 [Prevotella sp.]|nr:hypothetical protein [Prevotella sp.]MCM1074747.1 hypothetical protein [Ruminococcus sp.]
MTRKETIDKYIDAFLKGRSQAVIEKFKEKEEALQYASIMQWRRRMKKIENTPKSIRDVLELLRKANSMIDNTQEMSTPDMQAVNEELDKIRNSVAQCYDRTRANRIKELEAQQQQIAEQLANLRNG